MGSFFGQNWSSLVPPSWSSGDFSFDKLGTFDYGSNVMDVSKMGPPLLLLLPPPCAEQQAAAIFVLHTHIQAAAPHTPSPCQQLHS